jgi:hypothetical protein
VPRFTRLGVGEEAARTPPDVSAETFQEFRTTLHGSRTALQQFRATLLAEYPAEETPLIGWVRLARFNPVADRVAVLDFVYPNLKVFGADLDLRFTAALGVPEDPNAHGISDVLVTDDGAVVVVTERGWVGGFDAEGRALEFGAVDLTGRPNASVRLDRCGEGWRVMVGESARSSSVEEGDEPGRWSVGSWLETADPADPVNSASRPPVFVGGDPRTLERASLERVSAPDVSAGTSAACPPAGVARHAELADHVRFDSLDTTGRRVFLGGSAGVVVAPEGPGAWFAIGTLAADTRPPRPEPTNATLLLPDRP